MFFRRTLSFAALALCISLAGRQAVGAGPTGPATPPAAGQDSDQRGKIEEAGADLAAKDYDKAVAKYTKFIDGFGLENSCRA
jgi:hypothetical protein